MANEEFETMIKSQMVILKNQMDVIKDYIDNYDHRSMKLKQTITNDLIAAVLSRFERNEKMLLDLDEKLDASTMKIQSNMERSIKDLREEMSQAEMEKAIAKIFQDKEVKVNSKLLEDLRQA